MATVYKARDRRLDRVVALKLMHPHLADSPDFVARFRREARAAARLSNPGVVAVYDQGSIDGVAYLVMEFVDGTNLRDLLEAGPVSVKEALGLTAQILRPLAAAHRAGLVHRDIKPENVLLPADGSVAKVADFGLARAVTEVTQTTTGNVLGTVAYLAPELMTTGSSTPRADVYSVGIILFELLTGHQPFTADSPIQIAFQNVHEDVPAPSTRVPDMPAEVDRLVAQMTARDPQARLEDGDTALTRLRQVAASLSDAELAVHLGGGTGTVAAQEVLAANAAAASAAVSATPATAQEAAAPHAGLRTVSVPIGSIGPGPADGVTTMLPRGQAPQADGNETVVLSPLPRFLSRRALLVGAGVVLLGGGATTWYFTMGPGRTVTVPDTTGMSEDQAREVVQAVRLTWGPVTKAFSDTVPEGAVISTEPGAGSGARVGSEVLATISRGIEKKIVPDMTNMTQAQAAQALEDAGLSLGAVTQEYSPTVKEGLVASSSPAAGASIDHSSAVAIVVSKGRQPARVPEVKGKTLQEATAMLTAAGLKVGATTEEYSDTVESGKVISSDPEAGSGGHYAGEEVSLKLSKGPEMVTVPNVTGKSRDEAVSALEAAGLKADVSNVLGGLIDSVRSTDPEAGTSVRKGSTVKVSVW